MAESRENAGVMFVGLILPRCTGESTTALENVRYVAAKGCKRIRLATSGLCE